MSDRKRLDGQVFVVTGATQGLGAAIARRCAAEGAAGIVVCGRNEARARGVIDELKALGCDAVAAIGPLADIDYCNEIFAICRNHFGRVDGLVNAAGHNVPGTIDNTSAELWDEMFAVNARAPFLLSQNAVGMMKEGGHPGSIVNILSIAIHVGMPTLTPYAASKGALATLTRNVACSEKKHHIRCNGIVLGWTDTPGEGEFQRLEGKNNADNWREKAAAELPFGRLISPEDVAAFTVFLLSREAGVMTGSLVEYDQLVLGTFDI